MNCEESRHWLDAHGDGELDLPRTLEMDAHLRQCPACARTRENLLALRKQVGAAAFTAPDGLRQRVRAAVRPSPGPARPAVNWSWPQIIRWLGAAAAATAVLTLVLTLTVIRGGAERRVLDEITDSHIRSLAGAHLVDVVSSDQHTVRPWFEGKIDFAPPVPDLSARGFVIVGGRLDYLDGHSAAALVYQVRKHYLSVFIRPAAGEQGIQTRPAQRGYQVFEWTTGGLEYWAVSEIGADELRSFAEAFDQEAAGK